MTSRKYLNSKIVKFLCAISAVLELTAASNESQKLCQVGGSPEKVGRFNLGNWLTGSLTVVGLMVKRVVGSALIGCSLDTNSVADVLSVGDVAALVEKSSLNLSYQR